MGLNFKQTRELVHNELIALDEFTIGGKYSSKFGSYCSMMALVAALSLK